MSRESTGPRPRALPEDATMPAPAFLDRDRLREMLSAMRASAEPETFLKQADLAPDERYVLEYFDYIRYAESATREQYLRDIVEMYNFIQVPLSRYEDFHAKRYVDHLQLARGLKPSSIQTKMAAARSLSSYLHKKNRIPADVLSLIRLPKFSQDPEANILQRSLDIDQVDQVLSSIKGDFTARDISIFYSLARMGLRASELCALVWHTLSRRYTGWTFDVFGKGSKRRTVLIPDQGVHFLMVYREAVFGVPLGAPCPAWMMELPVYGRHSDPAQAMSRQNLWNIVVKISEHSALRHFSPHDLRHTCLTNLSTMGVSSDDLRILAGHSNVSTTSHYVNAGKTITSTTAKFNDSAALDRFRSQPSN